MRVGTKFIRNVPANGMVLDVDEFLELININSKLRYMLNFLEIERFFVLTFSIR